MQVGEIQSAVNVQGTRSKQTKIKSVAKHENNHPSSACGEYHSEDPKPTDQELGLPESNHRLSKHSLLFITGADWQQSDINPYAASG